MCVENSGYWIPDCENYVMILLNISRPSSQHSLNTHPPTSQHSMERFSSPLSDVGSFWCVFCVKTSPHWHDATQKGRWWEAWFGRCSQPRKWTVFVSFSLYILLTPILPLKASICRLKPPVIGEFEVSVVRVIHARKHVCFHVRHLSTSAEHESHPWQPVFMHGG